MSEPSTGTAPAAAGGVPYEPDVVTYARRDATAAGGSLGGMNATSMKAQANSAAETNDGKA